MAGLNLPLAEVLQILAPGRACPSLSHHVKSVVVDSRQLMPGDLFFALSGARVDGHDFLQEAVQRQACAAVVSEKFYARHATQFSLLLIPVPDVLLALQSLARNYLKKYCQAKIVAITGSVGKTSTKHLTTQLVQNHLSTAFSPGNQNSQIGLSLTLLNHVQGHEELLILEMGMTGKGQIQQLTTIAPPDIAVLTAVELVHMNELSSLQEIAEAKSEIFSHPKTQLGILPAEIAYRDLVLSAGSCKKHTFSSTSSQANFFLSRQSQEFTIVDVRGQSPSLPPLPFLGGHNYQNFLAAVSVCRTLGIEWGQIKETIPTLTLPEKRLEQIMKKGILFINDSYNAALASIKAALDSLPPPPNPSGKKIAVLGEMLELGSFSEACHKEIGEFSLEKVDRIICFGEGCTPIEEVWKKANKPVCVLTSLEQVIDELQRHVKSGDLVLLKGSNKKQLWEILKYF